MELSQSTTADLHLLSRDWAVGGLVLSAKARLAKAALALGVVSISFSCLHGRGGVYRSIPVRRAEATDLPGGSDPALHGNTGHRTAPCGAEAMARMIEINLLIPCEIRATGILRSIPRYWHQIAGTPPFGVKTVRLLTSLNNR